MGVTSISAAAAGDGHVGGMMAKDKVSGSRFLKWP